MLSYLTMRKLGVSHLGRDALTLVISWMLLTCMTWDLATLFTWYRGNLFERLDCALGNEAWINSFPNCLVTHLSKFKFDHRPLLLTLNSDVVLPRGRPFRFLAGWIEHPEFESFVKD